MITIFSIIIVVLLTIILNIGILIFVVPPVIEFFDKLIKGEIAANLFEMFIVCFIMCLATMGFFVFIASIF
jgi:hypothetical protein